MNVAIIDQAASILLALTDPTSINADMTLAAITLNSLVKSYEEDEYGIEHQDVLSFWIDSLFTAIEDY